VEPNSNRITDEYLNNYYLNEFANKFSKEYHEKLKKYNNNHQLLKTGTIPEQNHLNNIVLALKSSTLPTILMTTATTATTTTTTVTTTATTTVSITTIPEIVVSTTRDALFEPIFVKSIIETKAASETIREANAFSPLDELLIEKIDYLKSNKLNKTQMSNHLNVIKHIFEFKNRSKTETTESAITEAESFLPKTTTADVKIEVQSANRLMSSDEKADDSDLDWNLLLDYSQLKAVNEKSASVQSVLRSSGLNRNIEVINGMEENLPDLSRLNKAGERNLRAKQMAVSNVIGSSSVRPISLFKISNLVLIFVSFGVLV